MDEKSKSLIQEFCTELAAHDRFTWGLTCAGILKNADYDAPAKCYCDDDDASYSILFSMRDGRQVVLLRREGGWSIDWGKEVRERRENWQ